MNRSTCIQIIKFCWKRIRGALMAGMSTIGTLWTVRSILNTYFPEWEFMQKYSDKAACIIVPAVIVVLGYLFIIIIRIFFSEIQFEDIKIKIKIGNILKQTDGVITVGINNQLKTDKNEIGKISIHRQLIQLYGQQKINNIFNKNNKPEIKKQLFFQEEIAGKEFIFLLMSDLAENQTVSTTQKQIKCALESLFKNQQKLRVPQKCIYLPVLGTGESGRFSTDNKDVIMIIKKILESENDKKEKKIRKIDKVCIVVYWKDMFKVDWDALYQWLKLVQKNCIKCKGFWN